MASFLNKLPEQRAERAMPDLKPPLGHQEALLEANRCLYCYEPPCVPACPTSIDIPEFIRRIATGNVRGAAKVIFEANILGQSCARVCPVEVLCVGSCVYNRWGGAPIQIGRLQRHATDWAIERGERFFERGAATGKRVALIGAGPASLACAHELARLGHEAVIFEARELPGGLNTTGVAPYKMQAETALEEVRYILGIGVELKTGVQIGRDLSLDELEREFDAIFFGVGLGADSRLGVAGEELPGVIGAVGMIERIKCAPAWSADGVRFAVVIGGGNTAIDAVRALKKLQVPSVTMIYRRSEAEMPGYRHEVSYAKKEGVQFQYLARPLEILGDGKVRAVRCQALRLGAPDASGRRTPVESDEPPFEVPADLVVLAVGQERLRELVRQVPKLRFERGRIVIDPASGQTDNPRYFAGGDCANGAKEVVNAAAEGKLAARGIDRCLRGA